MKGLKNKIQTRQTYLNPRVRARSNIIVIPSQNIQQNILTKLLNQLSKQVDDLKVFNKLFEHNRYQSQRFVVYVVSWVVFNHL